MKLCRVIGTTVSTVKQPVYAGRKVLVVAPVDERFEIKGRSFLAVDLFQAGEGDTVLVAQEGNCGRQLVEDPQAPVHAVTMGIVDHLETADGVRVPPDLAATAPPSPAPAPPRAAED